jgi:hypothetical protein
VGPVAIEERGSVGGRALVHVHVKVVPGASQDALAGPYGDRLKLRVTAPPESGKANKAVLRLLAAALGLPVQDLALARGASNPLKTIAVSGLDAAEVSRRLLT